jgi:hypothetical protein
MLSCLCYNINMFSTSRDILNWAIAVSVVAVAVMLVWAMAYLIGMLRTLNDINRRVRNAIESFTLVMAHLQDKIQTTAGYMPMIMQGVTKLVDYFMKQRAERKAAKQDDDPMAQPRKQRTRKNV